MTQFTPNTVAGSRASAGGRLNVYTMMLFIALLSLLVACVYVVLRHNALFGNWNPFDMSSAAVGVSILSLPGLAG